MVCTSFWIWEFTRGIESAQWTFSSESTSWSRVSIYDMIVCLHEWTICQYSIRHTGSSINYDNELSDVIKRMLNILTDLNHCMTMIVLIWTDDLIENEIKADNMTTYLFNSRNCFTDCTVPFTDIDGDVKKSSLVVSSGSVRNRRACCYVISI